MHLMMMMMMMMMPMSSFQHLQTAAVTQDIYSCELLTANRRLQPITDMPKLTHLTPPSTNVRALGPICVCSALALPYGRQYVCGGKGGLQPRVILRSRTCSMYRQPMHSIFRSSW